MHILYWSCHGRRAEAFVPLALTCRTPVLPARFYPDTGFPVHSATLHNSQAEWLTPNLFILVPLLSVHLNSSMPIFIGRDFFKHRARIYTCSNTSSFSADLIYQGRIVPLYNNLKHVNSFIWVRQQVQVRPSVC